MSDRPVRRVAVIAVHGVADQQPGDTTEAIADLLANLDADGAPAYGPFKAEPIRIPVRTLKFSQRDDYQQRKFGQWADRGGRSTANDAGLDFMKSLVASYEPSGPEEMYETTVLHGSRSSTTDKGASVDIFEMYWADLSRLSQSWLRIFAEIYQLLFHLGSLGVHAIRAAQASETTPIPPKRWRQWARVQRLAANVLAHHILVLNLCLFALLLVLPANLETVRLRASAIVWVAFGVGAVLITGLVTYRAYGRSTSVAKLAASMLAAAAMVAVVVWRVGWIDRFAVQIVATILAGFGTCAVLAIVKRYDAHRPGVWKSTSWLIVFVFGAFLVFLVRHPLTDANAVIHSVLYSGELAYLMLRALWGVFLVCAGFAFLAGGSVVRAAKRSRANAAAIGRLKRLNWTARLTLSMPAVLFLLLMTVLWGALWPAMVKSAPFGEIKHQQLPITSTLVFGLEETLARIEARPGQRDRAGSIDHLVQALISSAAGVGFTALMGSVVIAFALALYGMGPSILTEVRSPPIPRDGTRSGRWLDAGFRISRWGGRLLVFAVLVCLWFAIVPVDIWPNLVVANDRILALAVMALGVAGGGLLLFRDKLKAATLGARVVLDILLDVDNYLREHPRESNPRGRIAARMASLLKFVYRERYDSIVIIAHSQGTVIAADLLRFLHFTKAEQPDEDLAAHGTTPIVLFTMGSPLRQLYGLRFPHLYQWARHDVSGPWTERNEAIAATTGPDPAELDLKLWVNAYRSGDYVGRYLWRPEACEFAYTVEEASFKHPWPAGPFKTIASEGGNRREFCIGSGAHTHYWDGTAPQIALQLDDLITRGTGSM